MLCLPFTLKILPTLFFTYFSLHGRKFFWENVWLLWQSVMSCKLETWEYADTFEAPQITSTQFVNILERNVKPTNLFSLPLFCGRYSWRVGILTCSQAAERWQNLLELSWVWYSAIHSSYAHGYQENFCFLCHWNSHPTLWPITQDFLLSDAAFPDL